MKDNIIRCQSRIIYIDGHCGKWVPRHHTDPLFKANTIRNEVKIMVSAETLS